MLLSDLNPYIYQFYFNFIAFFQNLSYPMEFHGSDYGGYKVSGKGLNDQSTVYSFGVGKDITFDLSLIQKYGLNVYAFDPTPDSIQWLEKQKLPEKFHSFEYGISNFNGKMKFYPPENPEYVSFSVIKRDNGRQYIEVHCRTLKTIMNELGHGSIDILKMDIEGSEYDIIDDIIHNSISVGQICVEFHHRFDSVGFERTLSAINALKEKGYQIASVLHNCQEITFINKTWNK